MERKESQVLLDHLGRVDLQERTETLVLPGPEARPEGTGSPERVAQWVNLAHRAYKESLERQDQEDCQALKVKQAILVTLCIAIRHMNQSHIHLILMTIRFISEIYIQSTGREQEAFIRRKIS